MRNLFPADAEFSQHKVPKEGTESHRYRRDLWPPGPWHLEDFDKVNWVDEATNLDCMLVRNAMGAWCGYVAVTEGHPCFAKGYNDVPSFKVHGGLTFSSFCQEGGKICHVPRAGRPDHVWWMGFDCHHGQDLSPGMLAMEKWMSERDGGDSKLWSKHKEYDPETGSISRGGYFDETYKSAAYARDETLRLARQLKEVTKNESIQ